MVLPKKSISLMAEWFSSGVVGELVNRASSYLGGNYELQTGVEDKLARLSFGLMKIQAVLVAAERRDIKNECVVHLMMDLKDAAFEADDMLGTFQHKVLEQKAVADGENQVSGSFLSFHNVAKRFRTAVSKILFSDHELQGLARVVDRVDRISAGVGDLLKLIELEGQAVKLSESLMKDRVTTSLLPMQHEVIGRDDKLEEIIRLLLESNESNNIDSGNKTVSVLPVVGNGGVGKTTLAQLVYNHETVRQYFSRRIWVCVSDRFDAGRLTREILDHVCSRSEFDGVMSLNKLQEILREKLTSERFLLVLDDVWDDGEKGNWETICAPLRSGTEGSKIVITTRIETVARTLGTMEPIPLQGLQQEEFWCLFKRFALCDKNPEEFPVLEEVGKRIACKLNGSPLAAKIVGGLLRENLDKEYWESIEKRAIWELPQDPDDGMAVRRLSQGSEYQNRYRSFLSGANIDSISRFRLYRFGSRYTRLI